MLETIFRTEGSDALSLRYIFAITALSSALGRPPTRARLRARSNPGIVFAVTFVWGDAARMNYPCS